VFRRRRKDEAPDELLVRIPYEDSDHSVFNCVGVHKGKQFMAFVTGASPWNPDIGSTLFAPSEPGWEERKRWYGVIHVFEMHGEHAQTVTFLGGTEAEGRAESGRRAFDQLNEAILMMDEPEFCDISIKPFRYEVDEYLFGLVVDEDEPTSATLWPNDIMFHAPWDGEYST
jgi:hypothetical protein